MLRFSHDNQAVITDFVLKSKLLASLSKKKGLVINLGCIKISLSLIIFTCPLKAYYLFIKALKSLIKYFTCYFFSNFVSIMHLKNVL